MEMDADIGQSMDEIRADVGALGHSGQKPGDVSTRQFSIERGAGRLLAARRFCSLSESATAYRREKLYA